METSILVPSFSEFLVQFCFRFSCWEDPTSLKDYRPKLLLQCYCNQFQRFPFSLRLRAPAYFVGQPSLVRLLAFVPSFTEFLVLDPLFSIEDRRTPDETGYFNRPPFLKTIPTFFWNSIENVTIGLLLFYLIHLLWLNAFFYFYRLFRPSLLCRNAVVEYFRYRRNSGTINYLLQLFFYRLLVVWLR